MTNRFDLEQQILTCWHVTDDIKTLADQGASVEDIKAIATVYEYHFQKLWSIFETMVSERQFAYVAAPASSLVEKVSSQITECNDDVFGSYIPTDDGAPIRLLYGTYDTNDGPMRMLGINRSTEGFTCRVENLDPLVNALVELNRHVT